MSYVRDHLMADENVIFHTRIHSIVFLPWGILTVLSLIATYYLRNHEQLMNIMRLVGMGFLLKMISSLIYYVTAEYAVTTSRVLGKTGLISISSLDILLVKVEAVRLSQNLLGRVFNFGNVIVTGTGGTEEILWDLPRPMEFRKIIQTQARKVLSDAPQEKQADTDSATKKNDQSHPLHIWQKKSANE